MAGPAKLGLLRIVASVLSLGLVSAVKTAVQPQDVPTNLLRREDPQVKTDNHSSDHWEVPAAEKMQVVLGSDALLSDITHDEANQEAGNIVTENAPNVGGWGGSCECPDGNVYQVGDNHDSCGSLACVGGTSGTCNRWHGSWARRKVECAGQATTATTYTMYDGATTGIGALGYLDSTVHVNHMDECKSLCTEDPDCDCFVWREFVSAGDALSDQPKLTLHGATREPDKSCRRWTSCDPDNFLYYNPFPANEADNWALLGGTGTFMKDKICYRYNLASDVSQRYAAHLPLCGTDCDCRKFCSQQVECAAKGNYCEGDREASDGECWCSVFTQSSWVGDSKTSVYCESQMTIDAIRGEAMITDHIGSWQETIHCVALKACTRTMVPAIYSDAQKNTCIDASAHCPVQLIENCESWRTCMKSESKIRSAVMVLRGIANQKTLNPALLQQNNGHGEAIYKEGCYENPFEHKKDDCPCFDEMELECKQALAVPTTLSMFNCMKCKLCHNPNICSPWKNLQCTDDGCDTSFLAVQDIGKATLIAQLNDMSKSALHKHALAMRISTVMIGQALDEDDIKAALVKLIVSHKVDVSRVADSIHGRRQPPGNTSSFEPAELEDALSGKAGSKSCR